MPVFGECSAARPVAWGSSSAISSARRRRRPSTPLARPRRSSSSSPGSSLERDDQLPAALGRDAVALAERVHPPRALDTEAGLQRTRRVVDARVDDAAVVAALVNGGLPLALDDGKADAGMALHELAGCREA
jgi:hypothetical protein